MTSSSKSSNPFLALLVAVAIVFALSACAYGVMAVHRIDAARDADSAPGSHRLLDQLDQHGVALLLIELAVLTVTILAAAGTDAYRKHRANGRDQD